MRVRNQDQAEEWMAYNRLVGAIRSLVAMNEMRVKQGKTPLVPHVRKLVLDGVEEWALLQMELLKPERK